MESSVVVDDSRGDAVTNRKAVSDLRRKSSVISEGRVQKVEAPIDESGLLTVAEKLMLEFLLEKERNGRRKSIPSPSLVKEETRRVPDSSRHFNFVKPHRPPSRKESSQEDRSVIQTMDELSHLSDSRLMRMIRECDGDGAEFRAGGTETDAGGFLAWYMTRSKFGGRTSDKSRPGTKTQKPISEASFGQSTKPSQKKPSTPLPARDDQGRIRFSFMQDPTEAPSTSVRDTIDDIRDADADASTSFCFATQPRSNRGFQDEFRFDDGVKLGKSERRRPRRPVSEEDEEEEGSFGSDLDHAPEFMSDMATSRKSKPRKKNREPVVSLWDPEKPRPMPRRLRRRPALPPSTAASQKAASSNGEKKNSEK